MEKINRVEFVGFLADYSTTSDAGDGILTTYRIYDPRDRSLRVFQLKGVCWIDPGTKVICKGIIKDKPPHDIEITSILPHKG